MDLADDSRVGSEHDNGLKMATKAGTVIPAGLALDEGGPAVVIIEAESDEDAHRFSVRIPFFANGLFTAALRPFRMSQR